MPAQVLALIGPTASGKTELAIELSKEYPCEVISLDSALVYCGMDIGTAKPSQEIRNQLPHHLVDIISPLENYNAARFVTDCTRLIQEISQRGRLALILGGSMMYYHALIYGLNYQELLKIDPFTAKRLPASDTQRIERALEVYYLTGKPISTLRLMPTKSSCNWPTLALVPMQKAQLHPIIAQRFHRMLREGVIDEVKQLKSCYPTLNLDYPSLRCVGYRQIWQYLSGELSKNV
ncbi:MAG: tRNA (adenosine(37)-N6)-dimethylallyltransferase MiaA, partial [Francisella sp.]